MDVKWLDEVPRTPVNGNRQKRSWESIKAKKQLKGWKKKRGLITRYKNILGEKRLATNGLFSLAENSITRTSIRKSQVIQRPIFTNERINLWNESQNQMMNFSSLFFSNAGKDLEDILWIDLS